MWSPSTDHVRKANLCAAVAWVLVIPIGWLLGWLESVLFVSAASIYANFVSHLAAQRADVPDPEIIARLDRIERAVASDAQPDSRITETRRKPHERHRHRDQSDEVLPP